MRLSCPSRGSRDKGGDLTHSHGMTVCREKLKVSDEGSGDELSSNERTRQEKGEGEDNVSGCS